MASKLATALTIVLGLYLAATLAYNAWLGTIGFVILGVRMG